MEKPFSIINLEAKLSIVIRRSKYSGNSFMTDANNNVVSLNLRHLEEVNLSMFDEFKNLDFLSLTNCKIENLTGIELFTKLSDLRISTSNIKNLKGIENLQLLQVLDLSHNELSDISELSKLQNLKILRLWNNKIENLTPLINLSNLENLDLDDNMIVNLEPLRKLYNLKNLYLRGNKIEEIYSLAKLRNIKNLHLSSNNIKDITALRNLENIDSLFIYGNKIENIESLKACVNLSYLDLSLNKITSIDSLSCLINLHNLDLSANRITNIDAITNLINLRELFLQNNNVNILPTLKLPFLKKLYIYDNQISKINKLEADIEYHFHRDHRFNGVLVGHNPLDTALVEILKSDRNVRRKALNDYFKNLELGSAPLLEAKLMILGEGEAGKTNLRNYIIDQSYEPGKSATTGIKIDTWTQNIENLEYRINLWDFGGQWIQQQVHQFFLTNESVYIILLNARQDEKPEKWLDWIKNYTVDSKVFIVANKMDENPNFSLEENLLKSEYPFIIDFHYISLLNANDQKCGEKEKIDQLLETIKFEITNLKNVKALIPTNYHDLKKDLEDNFFTVEHSVSFDKFKTNLFEKHNIIGQPEVLLDILEKIGTIRFFKKFDKLILSPEWLSGGVYKILMSDIASNKNGVIDEDDIKTIIVNDTLDQFKYRESDIPFIQKLMMDFKLAYIKGDQHFIPSQFLTDLPKNLSLTTIESSFEFKFYFEFDTYFPDIFISKFIVDFFDKVDGNNFWKTGILLKDIDHQLNKETYAFIISKEKQRRLFIYLNGDSIRNFFKEIYSNIKRFLEITGYKYQEIIEVKNYPVNYKNLLTYFKNGLSEMPVILGDNIRNFNVKDTLGLLNSDKEINRLKNELEEVKKEKNIKIIMGNELNFKDLTFGDNNQIGTDRSTQNNYINSYKNSNELEQIKILSNELKEYINGNEEWKKIFSDGFNDLLELENSNNFVEETQAKSKLKVFYDNAKKIVDWKNIVTLPVEIHEKGPKLLELLQNVIN